MWCMYVCVCYVHGIRCAIAGHHSLYSSVAERQSCKLKVLGSIPSGGFAGAADSTPHNMLHVCQTSLSANVWRASLAQLAEHALRKRMVVGSIPTGGLLLWRCGTTTESSWPNKLAGLGTTMKHAWKYTWPGSNWRPSACEADVIATRPQVLGVKWKLCANTKPLLLVEGCSRMGEPWPQQKR